MSITLSISSTAMDEDDLNNLTMDLCHTINKETDVDAKLAQAADTSPGSKGDLVTVGSVVLGLIGSGGVVVSLINVLKSYFERGRPIEIELEHPDGRKLKLKSENVEQKQLDQTIKLAREFFEVSP